MNKIKKTNFDIVIPTFNAENSIEILIKNIYSIFNNNSNFKLKKIIVVDDCSTDSTKDIVNSLKVNFSNLEYVLNNINLGQSKSTLKGIGRVESDYFITMDDDLQHPPSEIIKLLEATVLKKNDFVIGNWNPDEGKFRNISAYLASFIFNIFLLKNIGFKNTGFRCANSKIIPEILKKLDNNSMLDFRKVSNNFSTIIIKHEALPYKREYTSIYKRIKIALNFLLKDTYFLVILIFIFLINYLMYL